MTLFCIGAVIMAPKRPDKQPASARSNKVKTYGAFSGSSWPAWTGVFKVMGSNCNRSDQASAFFRSVTLNKLGSPSKVIRTAEFSARNCVAAAKAISGPIPAGSPEVITSSRGGDIIGID
jgi:hypothetical protein